MKISLKSIQLVTPAVVCGGVRIDALASSKGVMMTYDSELDAVVCERVGADTVLIPAASVVHMTPVVWGSVDKPLSTTDVVVAQEPISREAERTTAIVEESARSIESTKAESAADAAAPQPTMAAAVEKTPEPIVEQPKPVIEKRWGKKNRR